VFPPSLRTLDLRRYNHPLIPGVFPPSLRTLYLGRIFYQPIERGVLPNTLTTLYIRNDNYDKIRSDAIPASLVNYSPESISRYMNICPDDGHCTIENDYIDSIYTFFFQKGDYHWKHFRHILQNYPISDWDGGGYSNNADGPEGEWGAWAGGLHGWGTRRKLKVRNRKRTLKLKVRTRKSIRTRKLKVRTRKSIRTRKSKTCHEK